MARVNGFRALAATSVVSVVAALSCGGGGDDGGDGGDASGGTGSLNFSGTGSYQGNAGGAGSNLPMECVPPADDNGCVGLAYEGETQSTPTDIYVMFDVSCSMSCTVNETGCCAANQSPENSRIIPVRIAMESFLRDPASAGIGVGLGFFGDHSTNPRPTLRDTNICSAEAHSDAAVEIADLPGNADALVSMLNDTEPQGGTPTDLAIEGACQHVARWKEDNPNRKSVVLLVTDGIPEYSCFDNPNDDPANLAATAAAAAECYDNGSGTEVYVLGIESNYNNSGSSLVGLNEIAQAGGTNQAYLTDAEDIAGSMIEALNAIREDAVIPCNLSIPEPPPGETLNINRINLGVCDSSKTAIVTTRYDTGEDCGDRDGYYYDNMNAPEMIHLCDATCDTVSVPGSTLFFTIGCETQVEIQ